VETKGSKKAGPKRKQDDSQSANPSFGMGDRFLTLAFWWPMMCVTLGILIMTEIVYPLSDMVLRGMQVARLACECLQFAAVWLIFAGIVVYTWDLKAAGHKQLVAMATIMVAVSIMIIIFLGSFLIQAHGKHDATRELALDVAIGFRPFIRIILVLLIINVIVKAMGVDTGEIVMLLAFLILGIAFAISGVLTDIVSHVFIRIDEHFYEGEIISIYAGREFQVEKINWRTTVALDLGTRAQVYIPNRALSIGDTVTNLSRDNGRKIEYEIPLLGGLAAEDLQEIVRECWALVMASGEEGYTFKAADGNTYPNQLLTAKSMVNILSMSEASGGGEFAKFNLRLQLWGRYFFSNPPPWQGTGQAPTMLEGWSESPRLSFPRKRQLDWKDGWFAQIEHILMEVKGVVEKHSSKHIVSIKTT